eukprot:14698040-Alexandrium_andersonii.AAC.1
MFFPAAALLILFVRGSSLSVCPSLVDPPVLLVNGSEWLCCGIACLSISRCSAGLFGALPPPAMQ